ncbi:MAG TPA: response regulator [Anaerolineales bacterium]|nr:response regulator [Anaerolineales bacterium]
MPEKSILVVDESPASRVFLANHLRGKQFRTLEAPTGKEGLIVAWRDRPDLILFDPTLRDIPDEEFIRKLRQDARTAGMPLIALSSDPGEPRRERCLQAGVDEYLIKSSSALVALEESLARLFGVESDSPIEDPVEEEKRQGLLIVFLSAKGGTGTSSLCANLAMNIQQAQAEARVVVADLVLPIGSISQIVGEEGKLNLVTVADLPPEQTTTEYFHTNLPQPEPWRFQLLAGSPDPHLANRLKGERIGQIVDTLCSAYDFVILDIGRSLSRIGLPLIQKADLIVLIVSTDQSTVKLTQTIWNYLLGQGIHGQRVYAILNRAVGLEGLTKAQAEEMIGLPIKTTMPYLGGNFALANNLNQPLTMKYPMDTASIILKATADEMIGLAKQLRSTRQAA